jgi:hypothetical protein
MTLREYISVPVEFYIGPQILSGYLPVAAGRRLLDILNMISDLDRDVQSEYIGFTSDSGGPGGEAPQVRYVRKLSVGLAALSDPELARGAGAKVSTGLYPRVEKAGVRVSIELPGYSLDGTMHCSPGRTIRDVLDEDTMFLPMTEVTIIRDNRVYGSRPFVAVRKEQIVSVLQAKRGGISPADGKDGDPGDPVQGT